MKKKKLCVLAAAVAVFSVFICIDKEQTVNGYSGLSCKKTRNEFQEADMSAGFSVSDLLCKKPELCIGKGDAEILLKIAEAEAETEGVYGKALVMNVVLNRIKSSEFPDTVEEVVFQINSGIYQFCPVRNGSYYTADVSEESFMALNMVLFGWDESQGATYFCTPNAAYKWHEDNLLFLFQRGGHRFYKEKEGRGKI